ncbi:MAG TPA: citramalate synthase, partial [Dermatophilaceae bacterium]|nr:citramalate synthase [Dermatophilaceae bacterium]
MTDLHVYDTTLRDGAQQEGLNLSVSDKLAIAAHLDELGVGFIEGGWPGANPKDTEFFARAQHELTLHNASLAAFGATRRVGGNAADDPLVRALLDSGAPVVTIVAKSHIGHVQRALRTTPEENLEMVRDTVRFLTSEGRRVFLDAEHFFDGYAVDRAYAVEVARAAMESGAEVVALCDTNGGMLPGQVGDVVNDVLAATAARLGIHCHNDTGCAVANSMAAVEAGATHVQGTINGYGERTGNADLITVVSNLQIKRGLPLLEPHRLQEATRIAHAISEVTNVPPYSRQPYVGASAFAHKAGLHASAIKVDPDLYQHIDPELVGNERRILVSELSGQSTIVSKTAKYALANDKAVMAKILSQVQDLEYAGYEFEAAEASFDLLVRKATDQYRPWFERLAYRVNIEAAGAEGPPTTEATVKVRVGDATSHTASEGDGPVNALDGALRKALLPAFPRLAEMVLVDYKVRVV